MKIKGLLIIVICLSLIHISKNLSVSRSTVELAYDQLLAEGYIEAEPYRGYFVCDIEALYQLEPVSYTHLQ